MYIVIGIGALLVIAATVLAFKDQANWSLPATLAVSTALLAVLVNHRIPWWLIVILVLVFIGLIITTIAFYGSGVVVVLALLVALAGVVGTYAVLDSPTPKGPGTTLFTKPETKPSTSTSATTLNAKAANWVRSMTLNFAGVTELPAKCQNYVPSVDLTQIHWYARDDAKESPDAFGTSMGNNPCDIAINRVERAYQDPFYVLEKANEIKAVDPSFDFAPYTPDQQAARVTELQNAPFTEREALADKVLGWYSDPSRVLKIDQVNGAYTSSGASSVGGIVTTVASSADKSSIVVTTYDRKTGAVQKQDRANCGDQPYKPAPPITTPPTTPPTTGCTPPQVENVNHVCVTPKGAPWRAPGDGGKGADVGTGTKPPVTAAPTAETTPPPVATSHTGGGGVVDTSTSAPGSQTGVTAPGAAPAPATATTPPPNEGGSGSTIVTPF